MQITRNEVIKRLSESTGYYQKDIYALLKAFDGLVFDLFGQVTPEEDITIQLVEGIKVNCRIVPPRTIKNNFTNELIDVAPKIKIAAKISKNIKASTMEECFKVEEE